ncbi:hypothetical protein OG252_01510 [Streptomyces sp. NBC_01352]|uniref:hypothetical protein n=1 Tax=unclassified Streptomyces TaxID=2593676 RepID=UPI002E34485E|nr:hypothetical protein [Streptomyces sp. NBC_01352]
MHLSVSVAQCLCGLLFQGSVGTDGQVWVSVQVASLRGHAKNLLAGEDFIGCGGVGPGLQDGRRVGVLAEFVVVELPEHTVVYGLGGWDGGCRVEEPLGAFDLLGDPGQPGGVQHMEDVGHGCVRGVRVGGEGGQGLNPAVLRVAFQEPGWTVVVDAVDHADQGPARCGGDDGRLVQGGELSAGPGEMVRVGAEEGQVFGEAQDTAVEVLGAGLFLGQAEQLAAGYESVGGAKPSLPS